MDVQPATMDEEIENRLRDYTPERSCDQNIVWVLTCFVERTRNLPLRTITVSFSRQHRRYKPPTSSARLF